MGEARRGRSWTRRRLPDRSCRCSTRPAQYCHRTADGHPTTGAGAASVDLVKKFVPSGFGFYANNPHPRPPPGRTGRRCHGLPTMRAERVRRRAGASTGHRAVPLPHERRHRRQCALHRCSVGSRDRRSGRGLHRPASDGGRTRRLRDLGRVSGGLRGASRLGRALLAVVDPRHSTRRRGHRTAWSAGAGASSSHRPTSCGSTRPSVGTGARARRLEQFAEARGMSRSRRCTRGAQNRGDATGPPAVGDKDTCAGTLVQPCGRRRGPRRRLMTAVDFRPQGNLPLSGTRRERRGLRPSPRGNDLRAVLNRAMRRGRHVRDRFLVNRDAREPTKPPPREFVRQVC